jgi:bifunctional UDP-N-acetylglucosamine pyrophosphorylase/glucosamine-1-phosphate N-acetyltransferase
MRILHAIILAAGEGTRMKSELPKVLHPICGRPMIAYALDLAAAAGVKQPIVVLGKGADEVKRRLPTEAKAVIQANRLGTGDAVLTAKKALGSTAGAVLILYADTPLLRRTTVQKLIESHFKTGATCTLLSAHLADPSGYGRIVRNETGQISGVVEEAEATATQRAVREINVGPMLCNTQALLDALALVKPSAAKKELYLTAVVTHLAHQEGTKIQAVRVEESSEALGINSRTELARAIGVIRHRIIDTHLHNGVTIEDPQTTFIDQGVSIGHDSVIYPCSVIETGVSVGRRCSIGPFARLRTGTAIADDTRIGNFAELVRAKVGSDVRMNHVSYLGDAVVEDGVNVGAGTITANFDGREKQQTHIGKGAFLGCDTVLVAPVKVGASAVTGAGSVVTRGHDVPAKSVVVGVPARPIDRAGASKAGEEAAAGEAAAGGRDNHYRQAAKRTAPAATARSRAARPRATVGTKQAASARPQRAGLQPARAAAHRARPGARASRRAARRGS